MDQFKEAVKTIATDYIRYEIDCYVGNYDDKMKERILDEAELSFDACYGLIHKSGLYGQTQDILYELGIEALNIYYRTNVSEMYDHVYEIKMNEIYENKMNENKNLG
jgi:hypothetical protein